MDFFGKMGGFIFSPSFTFHDTKNDTLFDALKFYIPLLVINSVLRVVANIIIVSEVSMMLGQVISYEMLGGDEFFSCQ
ncbi:MAG: hypothetical protein SVM80_04225 [Halobacteriota archaeon]|nr:hypothetical protein [Halobacteriota archaeon]